MRKKWNMAATLCLTAVLLCACAAQNNDGNKSVAATNKTENEEDNHQLSLDALDPSAYGNVEGLNLEPGTYISIIGKSSGGQFWEAVKSGAERAVKDMNESLGYEGEDKIKVTYSGPSAENDVDEQVNILDEELARYPEAVGISVIDEKSGSVQFDLAAENNIPIVAFDSTNEYPGVMAKVSTNNAEAVRTLVTNLAVSMENKGEILIFTHDSKSATSRERRDVFIEELKNNYPEMTVGESYSLDDLESVKKAMAEEVKAGTYNKDDGTIKASAPVNEGTAEQQQSNDTSASNFTDEDVIKYIFAKHPNVKAIYGTNSQAVLYGVKACENQEKKEILIVGFDADNDQIKALEEGKVEGLIVQNPYAMGYAAIVASARSILQLGNEAEIDSGYSWMTKESLKDKEMRKLLY